MKTIEQLALEVAESECNVLITKQGIASFTEEWLTNFATRLLDKIAEQSEPVAWFCEDESTLSFAEMRGCSCIPLFAHPPKPDTDTEELDLLRTQVRELRHTRDKVIDYLERVCADKCNAEYNPCEARELLALMLAAPKPDTEIEEWKNAYNTKYTQCLKADSRAKKAEEELEALRKRDQDWQDAASEAATTAQAVIGGLRNQLTRYRAAMEMAVEALEWSVGGEPIPTKEIEALTALRSALKEE